jgi:sulfate adenylyltransferase subunit 1 (EFTu-like GTPase family)
VLDAFEEERERGITIDTSQIYFKTAARAYVIIDAPGHREFIRNMVTGASYAEAAILIVDACEGIREQTRRHVWLLTMVGIRDICVVVNKLDAVDYDREGYRALRAEIAGLFASLSLTPYAVIPVSALCGENIARRSSLMSWYYGPCLVEVLDSFDAKPFEERPFRFPVQDVYQMNGERIVVGRVESGSVPTGMSVWLLPADVPMKISAVKKYPLADAGCASYGDAIGLVLDNDAAVVRGDILVAGEPPQVDVRVRAHLFWFHGTYTSGDPAILRCATQEVPVRILLEKVFDPGDDSVTLDADRIEVGELARCSIEAERPLVTDYCSLIPELGRFVIERDGMPVGGGIVM